MINEKQLRTEIIRPALKALQLWSESAEELMMLTCAVESQGGTYVAQVQGPALGIFQMEPATHNSLWNVYLSRRTEFAYRILAAIFLTTRPPVEYLKYNLLYSAMMARIYYFTVEEALPDAKNVEKLAEYWDKYYNRNPNKGTAPEAIAAYNKLMNIKKAKA